MRFYDIRYACLPLLLRISTDKLPMPTTLQHILHPRSSPPPSPHLTSFPYDLPRKTKLSPTPRSNNPIPSHPHPQPHQGYHPSHHQQIFTYPTSPPYRLVSPYPRPPLLARSPCSSTSHAYRCCFKDCDRAFRGAVEPQACKNQGKWARRPREWR